MNVMFENAIIATPTWYLKCEIVCVTVTSDLHYGVV